MLRALLGSFVIVFMMMLVLFRSFWFAALAMLPLSVTITFIYGLIGLVGKDYDMPVAVLSSLTLGLSVDFAIHFLERARATQKETGDWQETMAHMFTERHGRSREMPSSLPSGSCLCCCRLSSRTTPSAFFSAPSWRYRARLR